jgi:hypothetical protein
MSFFGFGFPSLGECNSAVTHLACLRLAQSPGHLYAVPAFRWRQWACVVCDQGDVVETLAMFDSQGRLVAKPFTHLIPRGFRARSPPVAR